MKKVVFLFAVVVVFLSCRSSRLHTPPETVTLFDRYWKLIEVDGSAPGATNKEPFMIMRISENRVTGSGGCNSFFGKWDNPSGSHLTFSAIGATKMACPNMETETNFFSALEQADNYKVSGDTLSLHKGNLPALARFVAVDEN